METIKSFLKSMLLFILLPIPWFYMECTGKPRGSWNTWLLDGENSAKRQYSGSVIMMFNIWFGVVLTISFSMVVHFLCNDIPNGRIVDIVMVSLCVIWRSLLSPKIALSYETWNWMKAIKFAVRLYETDHTSKELIGKAVASFLVQEIVIAKKNDSFKEFNHLENVLRALNIWNGQRKDIAEQARKLDK